MRRDSGVADRFRVLLQHLPDRFLAQVIAHYLIAAIHGRHAVQNACC
jgi:hypothetical protein